MDWTADVDPFEAPEGRWCHPSTNLVLDFHGDPAAADLCVLSEGNHNMALRETLQRFQARMPPPAAYFYATTPPGPILTLLARGRLQIGNLVLSVSPHVFIGPPEVLDRLAAEGRVSDHRPFVRNQGNVLLVRKGNPKGIASVEDLVGKGATVFLSNPETEGASHRAYAATLAALSGDPAFLDRIDAVFGERIHHREAPASVAAGAADAAVVFHHLALHFTRLFPGVFEIVPLGGTVDRPEPLPGNVVGLTHAGLVGDGGRFGGAFFEFLLSETVADIYRRHGLLPLRGRGGPS